MERERKEIMNIGFWMCAVLVPCFGVMALVFGIGKEKTAILISGFNSLPKEEQVHYDRERMAKDMQNQCLVWTIVMLLGAAGAWLFTGYSAVAAYAVWLVMFFKEVHLDNEKAFRKYRL